MHSHIHKLSIAKLSYPIKHTLPFVNSTLQNLPPYQRHSPICKPSITKPLYSLSNAFSHLQIVHYKAFLLLIECIFPFTRCSLQSLPITYWMHSPIYKLYIKKPSYSLLDAFYHFKAFLLVIRCILPFLTHSITI